MIKSILKILLLYCPIIAFAFDNFDCLGSEPFWKLSISSKQITFKHDSLNIDMPSVEPKAAENMNIDHIRVFQTRRNSQDVFVIIQKQSCTDGMSDDVFEYEGLVILNGKVFHGCCSKKLILSD